MKDLFIYARFVSLNTPSGPCKFRKVCQYVVKYGTLELKNYHCVNLNNPNLKKLFHCIFQTNSRKVLGMEIDYLDPKNNDDRWLKEILEFVYSGGLDSWFN